MRSAPPTRHCVDATCASGVVQVPMTPAEAARQEQLLDEKRRVVRELSRRGMAARAASPLLGGTSLDVPKQQAAKQGGRPRRMSAKSLSSPSSPRSVGRASPPPAGIRAQSVPNLLDARLRDPPTTTPPSALELASVEHAIQAAEERAVTTVRSEFARLRQTLLQVPEE